MSNNVVCLTFVINRKVEEMSQSEFYLERSIDSCGAALARANTELAGSLRQIESTLALQAGTRAYVPASQSSVIAFFEQIEQMLNLADDVKAAAAKLDIA